MLVGHIYKKNGSNQWQKPCSSSVNTVYLQFDVGSVRAGGRLRLSAVTTHVLYVEKFILNAEFTLNALSHFRWNEISRV